MKGITPFLWYDDKAEEAANHYVSIFSKLDPKGSEITDISRYTEASAEVAGRPEGSVMTVAFKLNGEDFVALNGGPEFNFTEAISFMVNCENQDEVDFLWEQLTAGGDEAPCGWLRDRYGVSWQIVPTILNEMLGDKDPEKAERVMSAMLQMKKIEIDALKQAYDQA